MSDSVMIAIITALVAPAVLVVLKYWLEKGNKRLDNIISSIETLGSKLDDVSGGTRAVLRYRLIKDLGQALSRGYTDLKEFQELTNLYESYKTLGGNSVVDGMYERYCILEVKE